MITFKKSLVAATIGISLVAFSSSAFATNCKGDLNNDGKISAVDYSLMSQWIRTGSLPSGVKSPHNADMDGNGRVNNNDLNLLGQSTGKTCVTTSSAEATVKNKLTRIMQKNGFQPNQNKTNPFGGQCFGFANGIYKTLFGISMNYNHLNDGKWNSSYRGNTGFSPEPSHSRITGSLRARKWAESSNYSQLIKNEFTKSAPNNAKPGSFVQMAINNSKQLNSKGEPRPHSAIIYEVNSNGVTLYDANRGETDKIKLKTFTWQEFAKSYVGFTIYEPRNYK